MQKLIFATNNPNKLEEVKQMLEGLYKVIGLQEAGINEDVPENQETLEGNAREKAQYIHAKLKQNVFADDTGLEIEALNGEPGVYSARYAGPQRLAEDNMQKVLGNLKSKDNRKAQFRTAVCLILNNKEFIFEGRVLGEILKEKSGTAGFGYDPIFKPEGYAVSFAEMPAAEKNKISHRGRAIQKLVEFLKEKI